MSKQTKTNINLEKRAKNGKEMEIRTIGTVQVRSNDPTTADSRIIEGCAVVFDSDSQDMGFIEQVCKGAIDQDTIKRSDIYATLNHDASRGILGRSRFGKGTLKLDLRDDGLYYEFEAPHTALGDETLEMIRRGDIVGSSFAFTVESDDWVYDEVSAHRFIRKIDYLYDVSPVYEPAYLSTSATTRKLEDYSNTLKKLNEIEADFSEEIE